MKKCWIMGIVGLVLFADCTMLVHNTKFVEMLDKKDSIVWQEKYPVQAGIADGHIYIDKELNPGRLPYPCLYQILLFGRYYPSFLS